MQDADPLPVLLCYHVMIGYLLGFQGSLSRHIMLGIKVGSMLASFSLLGPLSYCTFAP